MRKQEDVQLKDVRIGDVVLYNGKQCFVLNTKPCLELEGFTEIHSMVIDSELSESAGAGLVNLFGESDFKISRFSLEDEIIPSEDM